MTTNQSILKNEKLSTYSFLKDMYEDDYFPNHLVDKCKTILIDLCIQIEHTKPKNLDELYELTHAATEKLNDMQEEFDDNDSEIETGARECFGMNFEYIAQAYGFENADVEELIATREW